MPESQQLRPSLAALLVAASAIFASRLALGESPSLEQLEIPPGTADEGLASNASSASGLPGRDSELEDLRARVAELEKAEAQRDAMAKPVLFGPSTDASQDKWTVKLGGHVQADYVNWAAASPAIVGDEDYFEFRRL